MNEHTLEGRIHKVLDRIFPTFRKLEIIHQGNFSVQFGHKEVEINNNLKTKTTSRGIYDVLLKIDDRNIILFELKKVGKILNEKDHLQALSYARLLKSYPPITVVSNGKETVIYNTYSGDQLDTTTIDNKTIKDLIKSSAEIASEKLDDAVKVLLNKNFNTLAEVVNERSQKLFDDISGTLEEFWQPITNGFSIEREVVEKIQQEFNSKKNKLIGLISPPLGGKTNLLYQFFNKSKTDDNLSIYIDCNDVNYSLFTLLSNSITKTTKVSVSEAEVKNWLYNHLSSEDDLKIYLLLDNYSKKTNPSIQTEIRELLDFTDGNKFHVLYTFDEYNQQKLFTVPNRTSLTRFGRESICFYLKPLNNNEFSSMANSLSDQFSINFQNGSQHNKEFRQPRVIRQIIVIGSKNKRDGEFYSTSTITDLGFCRYISEFDMYPTVLHDMMGQLAVVALDDRINRKKDKKFISFTWGTGAVDQNNFKKKYPKDFRKLMKSGFVSARSIDSYKTFLFPHFPEILTIHLVEEVFKHLFVKDKDRYKSISELVDELIGTINLFPYPEIIGHGVLMKFAEKYNTDSFLQILDELLSRPPFMSKLGEGSIVRMKIHGQIHDFKVDKDWEDAGFIERDMPYMILSHLASQVFSIDKRKDEVDLSYYKKILKTVGSAKTTLFRPHSHDLANISQFLHIEAKGIGSFVDYSEGVVEPITQSIQKCFIFYPNIISEIMDEVIADKNLILCSRIYIATKALAHSADETIRIASTEICKKCIKCLDSVLTEN